MDFTINGQRIAVNVSGWAALEDQVTKRFVAGQGFALATINLDHLVKLRTDAAFMSAYQAQDLVVADGNPIVWMSRLARQPVELVPGSEAILPLAQWAARAGVKVALLGSSQSSLAGAKSYLERNIAGLEIVSCIAPPMGFDPDGDQAEALLQQIAEAGAGLCFIAMGAPKQEILAAKGRQVAPTVGFACIGAGLDFLAGSQKRAPKWARRLAIEWLWRMLSNPRRLASRYLKCMAILPGHVVAAMSMRLRS
ncbi:MAG: WecB/TagA/CpsF family glycosyltransferase [Pelagimonas sp.]|jgi:exopolysaccharide biosynthesis WecB/TagA/CpsF family protein|nr:WecB/TagA/CpsF family glycosyltransferase [Pelagimonas sp.]